MKKLTLLINSIFFNYLISFASLNLLIITLYFFNYKNAVIEVALFGSFVSVACQIFSFNSRSLLLSKKIKLSFENAIFQRIFFSFPIFLITLSFIFFYNFSDKTLVFVILLAIISNWLLELVFSDKELKSKSSVKSHLVFSILIYLLIVLFLFINNIFLTKICIFSFSILNFSILYNVLNKKILKLKLPILEFKNIFKILLLSSFGSSLSIGISNFFFRYFIIELAPVQTASTIIIGFMFGSLPLSLFFNIFGPSIVKDNINFLKIINFILKFLLIIIIVSFSLYLINIEKIDIKDIRLIIENNYLIFTSLISLIGFLPMIIGFYYRQIFIQQIGKESFFYLDIFYALCVTIIIPLIYVFNDTLIYSFAFFINGIFAFTIFYFLRILRSIKFIKLLIFLVPLPIFFSVFNSIKNYEFRLFNLLDKDMAEHIYNLPMPISLFVIPILTIVLISSIRFRIKTIYYVIGSFFLAIFATLYTNRLNFINFLNISQFYLPMMGLISGEIIGRRAALKKYFNNYYFFSVLTIMSIQLLTFISFNLDHLPFNFKFFNIYKNLDYTTFAFGLGISLYLYRLFDKSKINETKLIYKIIIFSISVLYLIISNIYSLYLFYFYLIFMFLLIKFREIKKDYFIFILLIIFIFLVVKLFFYLSANSIEIFSTHRLQSYNIFIKIISLDYISFLFGSNSQNQIYLTIPGVFNYYLDFIYNFGFISLIPILFLIIYTIKEVIINPKILRILKVEDLIIFLIIFYMIFIDSFIRTSFKQPYLGIILFILWGILISKLSSFKKNDNI